MVAESLITVLPLPWLPVPTLILISVATWVGVRGLRQRVHSRGFARRYVTCVVTWGVLHGAYLFTLLANDRDITVGLIGALVVAAPLFLAAYLEYRRSR